MSNCKWCGASTTSLVQGYCFECHKMGVIWNLGSNIQYLEYEALTSEDIDSAHQMGWLLKDTLYVFGCSSSFIN